jgi:hypothetical protein
MEVKPFKPFRICLSDGRSYDVTNHDQALVGKNSVEIGMKPDAEGFAEYFSGCAIMHITRIEDLQPV